MERNIYLRQNRNGTQSVSFQRSIKKHRMSMTFSQLGSEATVKERFDALRKLNHRLDDMAWLSDSRESMVDLIMKHQYIYAEGVMGKNARLALQQGGRRRTWSLQKYGTAKAIKLCVNTLLTRLNIAGANRVVLGAVLTNRALERVNLLAYNKRNGVEDKSDIRKQLVKLHREFNVKQKTLKGMGAKAWISDEFISAYITLSYRLNIVWDGKQWRGILQKCLTVDSINVEPENQRKGHFKSLMNEILKFASRRDYDSTMIMNVINPEFHDYLCRNEVFSLMPEDETGRINEYTNTFIHRHNVNFVSRDIKN